MPQHEPIDIGEAARRLGVTPATLRLYERKGLLPKAARSPAGYRRYGPDDLRRARWIRRARRAGLSMRQIANVLAAPDELRGVLRHHVDRLEREARRMERLRRNLRRWLANGAGEA